MRDLLGPGVTGNDGLNMIDKGNEELPPGVKTDEPNNVERRADEKIKLILRLIPTF